jgi:hypothetical protein
MVVQTEQRNVVQRGIMGQRLADAADGRLGAISHVSVAQHLRDRGIQLLAAPHILEPLQ